MALKAQKMMMGVMIQPTPDVFVAATAADYHPFANATMNIEGVTVENPEYTGSIHKISPEVVGRNVTLTFDMMMRPPVGGAVPAANAWVPGRILQAAKGTETRFTTGIPSEALGAGSTTTALVLGAGAVAVADTYKGMLVSAGAGTYGQKLTAVRSYSAAKMALLCETYTIAPTGNYEIRPQLVYSRSITNSDPIKLCASLWFDAVRYDLVNLSVSGFSIILNDQGREGGDNCMFRVTLSGNLSAFADQAAPFLAAQGTIPKFRDGDYWIANVPVGGQSLEVDFGLRVAYPPNPNKPDGSDPGELVESKVSVSINLQKTLKATFDALAFADGQAQYPIWARWGNGPGTTCSVIIPDARFNYQSPQGGQDFVMESGQMLVDVFDRSWSIVFPY